MTWVDRISFDAAAMGGKPCIRYMRVTVGTIVGLMAAGRTGQEILKAYRISNPRISAQRLLTQHGAPEAVAATTEQIDEASDRPGSLVSVAEFVRRAARQGHAEFRSKSCLPALCSLPAIPVIPGIAVLV